jgi:hypothetical protein
MTAQSPSFRDQLAFPWQNSERPIEERVELLLAEMNLEEKVGQLGSKWVGIAFVGDLAGMFGRGTSGEGCDAEDLRLPGVQADLLDALLEVGTPVVIVVVSGRPYALSEVHGRAAALVQAFMPREEGGQAIAGVLSGRIQPSGRLPVQIPRHGGRPGTYLQPPLGAHNTDTSNLDPTPLFPFGHGRSYTTVEIENLPLSSTEIPTDGAVIASPHRGAGRGENSPWPVGLRPALPGSGTADRVDSRCGPQRCLVTTLNFGARTAA